MRIVLIGNYGASNVGDEAVLSGLLIWAEKKYPGSEVTVLSYDPGETSKSHKCRSEYLLPFGFRSLFRGHFFHTLRVLYRADRIFIGGGALFTDEKMFAMFLWGYHVFISRACTKNVHLIANTVGPLSTRLGKWIMRGVLKMVHSITVRDRQSLQVIQSLDPLNFSLFTLHSSLVSDPAFLIPPIEGVQKKHQILISLRPWPTLDTNLLDQLTEALNTLRNKGYEILLCPFQTTHDDDRIPLKILFENIKRMNDQNVAFLDTLQTLPDIQKHLAESEFVIGMRLHSLILSTLQHTPFIALSYSQKVQNFTEEVGMERYCIPLENLSAAALLNTSIELEKNHPDLIANLEEQEKQKREKALV